MIYDFIEEIRAKSLSNDLNAQAKRCLLDTLSIAAAGSQTALALIMKSLVTTHYLGQQSSSLLFSQATASPLGAALYGAAAIDSLDGHDGHVLTKGHVGVSVIPALIALAEHKKLSGENFLKAIVIGYEIATRAGVALHQTTCDFHTSGAWNCLGVVTLGSYLMKLNQEQLEHALGIAEFYGPRSQMMRLIDHPSMLKDGSAFGALTGLTALYLAKEGFTGAPAVTTLQDEVEDLWADLGTRWCIFEQYFKAYPVCRWAQPAVECVLQLKRTHKLQAKQIQSIEVFSFHEAIRLTATDVKHTEEAQYSLPYPVAAALMDDDVTTEAISLKGKHQERVALAKKVKLIEKDSYNQKFPAERWAHARIALTNGKSYTSEAMEARGDAHAPLSKEEIDQKFFKLCNPITGQEKARAIYNAVERLEQEESVTSFLQLLV